MRASVLAALHIIAIYLFLCFFDAVGKQKRLLAFDILIFKKICRKQNKNNMFYAAVNSPSLCLLGSVYLREHYCVCVPHSSTHFTICYSIYIIQRNTLSIRLKGNNEHGTPLSPFHSVHTCHKFSLGSELSYHSSIKSVIIRLCCVVVCVLACTESGIMNPCRALLKGFARGQMWTGLCESNRQWAGVFFFLQRLTFSMFVSLLNDHVHVPQGAAHHQQASFGTLGSTLVPLREKGQE